MHQISGLEIFYSILIIILIVLIKNLIILFLKSIYRIYKQTQQHNIQYYLFYSKIEKIIFDHFDQFHGVQIFYKTNIRHIKLIQHHADKINEKFPKIGKNTFVITLEMSQNFIIIINCNESAQTHSTFLKNKYNEYSLDKCISYCKVLSSNYNVICISIIGDYIKNIETYSHKLGAKNYKKLDIQKLMDLNFYEFDCF